MSDALTVEYLTRAFAQPDHLKRYSLEQVAQGIWFLIGEASPGRASYALVSTSVALQERVACVQAMVEFFRTFIAVVAPGPANTESDAFHTACYMWWDLLWHTFTSGGRTAGEHELHSMCVTAMTEILGLRSDLCRLSALHGLNHWHRHDGEQVERTIDAFTRNTPDIAPRIREYAAKARSGQCQ